MSLVQALQHSINAVFCQIGQKLGPFPILDEAKKFGFYSLPPLDTPPDERKASGLYRTEALHPRDPNQVDVGRLAFGQERRLLVTPLQMAMVAAGVGNDGVVMQPQLLDRVVAPNGTLTTSFHPHELGRALSIEHAQQLNYDDAVGRDRRDGHRRADPRDPRRGKDGHRRDRDRPREHDLVHRLRPGGQPAGRRRGRARAPARVGGTTAAPIAKQVLQALLSPSGTNTCHRWRSQTP